MNSKSTQETFARPGFRAAVVCALLFCGTILLFSRITHFGFINYDDPSYVTENPHVQGGLSWDGFIWAFTAPTDYWHPLTWLSHMLDWQLYGLSASGHHFTSVLWHALNAVLVFLLFRRLAGGFWLSAFAAALFAWHPLRVESVAWITERKDVMSGCFFLLTLIAYLRYAECRAAGSRWWRPYLLALACFAAGLMSKPMLVTLPFVLLILDFWPFARNSSPASLRFLLIEKIPFFALSIFTTVITVLMQRREGAFVLDLPLGARAGNAVVSLARYLGKFFCPFDLVVCYSHPGHWPALAVIAASAFALAICWLAWRQRRSRPWILAGWLWFLVVLLPVIGLVQVGFQAIADRYTYLPLLGIELALLWSLPGLNTIRPWCRAAAATLILAACAARTWNQEGIWRDSVSLFQHAVAVDDRNDVAEYFLASALYAAGRLDESAAHAEHSRILNPRSDKPLIALAGVRERQGRINEAMEFLGLALALRPDNPSVQAQLGLLKLGSGHIDEARKLMTDALRSAPDLRGRTLELGRTALENRDPASARFLYDIVLAVAPDDAAAHTELGQLLLLTGDRAAALAEWRRALDLDPNIPGLREQLMQQEK
jgi:tetratricopeptide (TPR) repeat protein